MANVSDHRPTTDPGSPGRDSARTKPGEPNNPDRSLRDQVRAAVLADSRTKHAIARDAGVSHQHVYNLVSGKYNLNFSTVARIARVVGLRLLPAVEGAGDLADDQLRAAVLADPRSRRAIMNAVGMGHHLSRYLSGKRGIRLDLADRIAAAVGRSFGPSESTVQIVPSRSLAILIDDRLRADGRSIFAIALAAGINPRAMYQLASGKHDLYLTTATRIFTFLGIRLLPAVEGAGDLADDQLRAAVLADGRTFHAIDMAAGLAANTVKLFISGRKDPSLATADRIAAAVGRSFGLASATATQQAATVSRAEPREPSPWDDWDATVCPVHVRDDGHLIVFGRDKGPTSGSARKLFEAMEAKYPGGFTLNDFNKDQIVGDPRGILTRYREKDLDCLAAIQLPKVRKGGLYRFGRANESTIMESTQNE
jgi:plasmid maintenance system antidote protein VapI